jgi:hypothetical protein
MTEWARIPALLPAQRPRALRCFTSTENRKRASAVQLDRYVLDRGALIRSQLSDNVNAPKGGLKRRPVQTNRDQPGRRRWSRRAKGRASAR